MIDRVAGSRLLRHLRESRGWSWADLARALRDTAHRLSLTSLMNRQVASIQRTVARWESSSDRTSPGDRYQVLLVHLYARNPSGDWALGPGSDLEALCDALRYFGTSTERIEELKVFVARSMRGTQGSPLVMLSPSIQPEMTAINRDPSRLDSAVVATLRDSVAAINGAVGSVPFVRLQLQLAPILESCRRLLQRDQATLNDELLLLATSTYSLAARLAFETRDDEVAEHLYREATRITGHLNDRSHRAGVHTSHTMVTLHTTNDPNLARELSRAATLDAHNGASYAVRARAHAVRAEVSARAGQLREAAEALDRAWKIVDHTTDGDPHGQFNADRLVGFDGLCALHAGDATRAHEKLSRALASLHDRRDAVQRGIVSADLAMAKLRLGDPSSCVYILHEAIDTATATGGRVTTQRIQLARRSLRPWRAETFVTELDDHIYESLIGH